MRWLVVLALWLGLASLLPAQVARIVREDPSGSGQTEIVVTMSGGAAEAFGIGFARFEIQNSTPAAQSVSVRLFSSRYSGSDVSSERNLVVAPGQTRFFLPIPIPPVEYRLEATIGGELFRQRLYYRGGAGVVGLFVSDMSGRESFGTRVLELVPSASLGISPQQVKMQSQDLPTDWRMLTAFSILVVDGEGASGMSGELQEAVRRYAYAGGTVVVSSPRSLPSGSLRDLGEQALDRVHQHGFGRIAAVPAFGRDQDTMEMLLAQLSPIGVSTWPANQALFPVQEIEGLGKAPVTVFVLIIVAFAVLVGPLNFLFLRRRKKPLLALLTVPVMGFGTTIVILAYGILHDGFGVRGVVHSCTLLDQQSHEAVCLNASTLFAGMAPSSMTMAPDTMLMSARAGVDNDDWLDRWSWNADTQRLDGGILPSRTITPLLAVQQGPVRERLTVRRSGDTLEVLLDGGLQPVGSVVLCDLEGQYWTGSDAVLQRVSAAAGQRAFAALRAEACTVSNIEKMPVWPQRLPLKLPTEPQRGSYATRVASAPWLDDHGVSVAYDAASHFVFGSMHAQDFVQ